MVEPLVDESLAQSSVQQSIVEYWGQSMSQSIVEHLVQSMSQSIVGHLVASMVEHFEHFAHARYVVEASPPP